MSTSGPSMRMAIAAFAVGAAMLTASVSVQADTGPFDVTNTPIEKLMNDPRTWQIVVRHAPMLRSDNPDGVARQLVEQGGSMTLKEIQVATKAYAGVGSEITDKMLSDIDAELRKIDFGSSVEK